MFFFVLEALYKIGICFENAERALLDFDQNRFSLLNTVNIHFMAIQIPFELWAAIVYQFAKNNNISMLQKV